MSLIRRLDYRRAIAVLAGHDRRIHPLAYVTREAQRTCAAAIAVLLGLLADGAALDALSTHGPGARSLARRLAALGASELGPTIRLADADHHRVLTAPITTPDGIVGFLIVGRPAPSRFTEMQRRYLRDLADIASVAFQLAHLRGSPSPRSAIPGDHRPLNRREREVVTLLLGGASAKEAAVQLGISQRTVETYLQRLKDRERQPRLQALLAKLVREGRA
ncbi:MAG: hypothetical protein HY270_10245 [Deltaproteobacteria bacterium]|nr:hypothetical protein [Deltaproteobacteria bacterium]